MITIKVINNSKTTSVRQRPIRNQLPEATNLNIGNNLSTVNDWSFQRPFLDLFKNSRPWVSSDSINLDSKGWFKPITSSEDELPKGQPVATIFTNRRNTELNGQYVVLYDGEGTINYNNAAVKNIGLSRPGRDVITINATNTLTSSALRISSNDPNRTGNYIRNIRIIPLQYENTYTNVYSQDTFNPSTAQIFNPNFLTEVKKLKVVRYMDWGHTNGSTQKDWSDRPTLDQAFWTEKGKGVPIEVMVALSNQASVDPWFNVPHMATDDYVRNFAQYVKNNIDPSRKIYIEYTNEGWNPSFPQTQWIMTQAGSTQRQPYLEWYTKRSVEVIDIWKQTFGTDSNRIIGVVVPQAASVNTGRIIINYLKSTNTISKVDGIGIAPYFGYYIGHPMFGGQLENMTVDDIFDEINQGGALKINGAPYRPNGALQQTFGWMDAYAKLIKETNDTVKDSKLQLLASEGGQHLDPFGPITSNTKILNLFAAVNRDPRMGEVYQKYLAKWNEIGGGTFMHFGLTNEPSPWMNQFISSPLTTRS